VLRNGLHPKDAVVNCFIKNEVTTTATDPRNISPRTDTFLSVLGPYISAIEEASHVCEYLVKGKTMSQRDTSMSWILDFEKLIETDYSRLDMTLNDVIIDDVETEMFRQIYPCAEHPLFAEALALLTQIFGYTSLGYFYEVFGERCSGDAHTSIGNGLCCRFIQWFVMRRHKKQSWRSQHEGDDGILGVTSKIFNQTIVNLMTIACFGLKIKLIYPTQLEEATFCGRLYSRLNAGITSHTDLRRCLGKFHVTTSHLPAKRAVLAKALSYWHTDAHTPIVGALCHKLITLLRITRSDVKSLRNAHMDGYQRIKILSALRDNNFGYVTPTAEARTAVSIYCGIDPDLQMSMENEILSWSFVPANVSQIVVDPIVDDERCTFYGPHYPSFTVGRELKC
jgi:hypothetical protein